ncbi:uncharacterized protein STEHIDRAFT_145965, partial [Stereum hirsutum FP-91666 SS1]|uniref:uncharacterized protein n=1 Tax=Stereum hirsutum (strain FP-91666) TaxID=721885 RepID=UPI000440DB7D
MGWVWRGTEIKMEGIQYRDNDTNEHATHINIDSSHIPNKTNARVCVSTSPHPYASQLRCIKSFSVSLSPGSIRPLYQTHPFCFIFIFSCLPLSASYSSSRLVLTAVSLQPLPGEPLFFL